MLGLITSLAPGLFKLGGKLIEDKDKKAEYAFKVQDNIQELTLKLMETKTYPWIDGLTKLAYASESIVKGLFRPLGAAAMTGFAIYADYKGINLSAVAETALYAAFPAWGASRHTEKSKKAQSTNTEDSVW